MTGYNFWHFIVNIEFIAPVVIFTVIQLFF